MFTSNCSFSKDGTRKVANYNLRADGTLHTKANPETGRGGAENGAVAVNRLPSSYHSAGGTSDSTVQNRYTPKMAVMVGKRYKDDLRMFGYEEWNGNGM